MLCHLDHALTRLITFFDANEGSLRLYLFTVSTLHEHQHKTFIKRNYFSTKYATPFGKKLFIFLHLLF